MLPNINIFSGSSIVNKTRPKTKKDDNKNNL